MRGLVRIDPLAAPAAESKMVSATKVAPMCPIVCSAVTAATRSVAAIRLSIEPKTVSHSRSQGVVPAGQRVEIGDAKSRKTVLGHLQAFWIVAPVEISLDTKAGLGFRSADEVKHRLVGA